MKILIIDNFDSFTFNLYQLVGEMLSGSLDTLDVKRNNQITIKEIEQEKYDGIIISPGPGAPDDPAYFGVCGRVLTQTGQHTPVLGVCLGMQGMAHHFGGKVIKALIPMHGKTSKIRHDTKGVFGHIPQHIHVMRYHSLVADPQSIPSCLVVTATVPETGEIMGLRHTTYPIEGIQFHPESFGTEYGKKMIENFLKKI